MVRTASMTIAGGLVVLAAIGFLTGGAVWLASAHLLAAAAAGVVALEVRPGAEGKLAVGLPSVVGLSLLIVALCAAAAAPAWQAWVTLASALSLLGVAAGAMPGGFQRYRPHHGAH